MNKLISVIIPAYNAEKVISESIDSALGQTYGNIEIIVIDDCSTDGTYDLVSKLCDGDSRIKIQKNSTNCGVSETRNRGVRMAKGEYIAFLDSDDKWYPQKLEAQLELAEKYPDCPIFYTGVSYMNDAGEMYGYTFSVPESVDYGTLLKQNIIACSSALVKREVLLKYPFEHDEMHEDFAVWLQILRDIGDAHGVSDAYLCYRLASGTKSSNKFKSALMTWRVYRYVGLNFIKSLYYMPFYMISGVVKYRRIGKSK